MTFLFRVLFLFLAISQPENPDSSLTLAWNVSPEQNVINYRVYQVTPKGTRGSASWDAIGSTTMTQWVATGLIPGSYHIYAVTAVNNIGFESQRGYCTPPIVRAP